MILEGDGLVVIQAINIDKECEAWFGATIEDAKEVLKHGLLWSLEFTHREGNGAAHVLVKLGLN